MLYLKFIYRNVFICSKEKLPYLTKTFLTVHSCKKISTKHFFLKIICCSLPPHTKAVSLRADPGFPCVFLSEPLRLFLNVISNFLASTDWENCFLPGNHSITLGWDLGRWTLSFILSQLILSCNTFHPFLLVHIHPFVTPTNPRIALNQRLEIQGTCLKIVKWLYSKTTSS